MNNTNKPEVVLPELPAHMGTIRIYAAGGGDELATVAAYTADQMRAYGQACIDTLTRPADGDFVMVPREATEAMIDAWFAAKRGPLETNVSRFGPAYTAMLSAAPQQHGQEVDEAERGLQTPRRVKAVELLLSLGYQWDGAQWDQPQQPAEAVAVDLEQFRKPVEFWLAHSEKMMPEMRTTATVEAPRLLAIIDSTPPAIDIGKLRELVKRVETLAYRQHRDGGMGPLGADLLNIANGIAALIGDTKPEN